MQKKIILGLAGEIACGKGTFSKYIVEHYEGSAYRLSTPLREILHMLDLPETRFNIQEISIALRRNFGEDVLSKALYKKIMQDEHGIIAIDGIRRFEDIKGIADFPGFRLVYIEAAVKARYERVRTCGENMYDINKTFDEFKKDHDREPEQRIRKFKEKADYVIDNNSTLEKYHSKIDEIIKKELS